jgi:hypothetical protein
VRKNLSSFLTFLGIAAGGAAALGFMALIWPDLDFYAANAIRTVPRTFISAGLIWAGVAWPFTWLAGRLTPVDPPFGVTKSTNIASSASDPRRRHEPTTKL